MLHPWLVILNPNKILKILSMTLGEQRGRKAMIRIEKCVSQDFNLKGNFLFQAGVAVAAFLLPVLAALLASDPASAQANIPNKHSVSGIETPTAANTAAGPARPKLKYDGHFRLRSNDETYKYSLYY